MSDTLHPVIEHLRDRRESLHLGAGVPFVADDDAESTGSPAPRRFADGRKIGLVVQGGAMRGVFSAGCLCGLEELGLRECFDVVYGASGGAINAAYLLAGQVYYGTSIYYSDINNRSFIDPTRILQGTAVGIDYCFDEVIGRRKRLNLERILDHPTPLEIFLTDAEELRPHTFTQHDASSPDELLLMLKTSAAMPFVYRKRLEIRGRRYVDGAFVEPVPLARAIADGCTDVLVLLSRPLGEWGPSVPGWLRPFMNRSINPGRIDACETAWREGQARLQDTLRILMSGDPVERDGTTVHIATITPPDPFEVSRWTKERSLLAGAAIEGATRVFEAAGISRDTLQPHEAIRLHA
jgi:predicted patatin/cPLA2 family phospholipase